MGSFPEKYYAKKKKMLPKCRRTKECFTLLLYLVWSNVSSVKGICSYLGRLRIQASQKDLDHYYVTGKLPTYPSPKPTLTLISHLGQNVGLKEGLVGSFPLYLRQGGSCPVEVKCDSCLTKEQAGVQVFFGPFEIIV